MVLYQIKYSLTLIGSLQFLVPCSHNLEKLKISDVQDTCLNSIALNCPNLRSLTIHDGVSDGSGLCKGIPFLFWCSYMVHSVGLVSGSSRTTPFAGFLSKYTISCYQISHLKDFSFRQQITNLLSPKIMSLSLCGFSEVSSDNVIAVNFCQVQK